MHGAKCEKYLGEKGNNGKSPAQNARKQDKRT